MLTITCYNGRLLIYLCIERRLVFLFLKNPFLIWLVFVSHQCKNGGFERAKFLMLFVTTQDTQMKDSELKTLERDILNPDWLINLEINNKSRKSSI